ncbi:glycosyl transferase [Terrihabitans sp. B22-R8]|uniref:glycosyl transferase n=1 Tax=Terrihabitans sp. B22-R8 TaxID=3425128 RepID=UPI00403CFF86
MSLTRAPIFTRHQRKPLHRRLIKLSLIGIPRWSHAHNWLPALRLKRDEKGSFCAATFQGQDVCTLHPARILKEATVQDELFVVGSGPSVATTSFDAVGPKSAILLNGACTLIGETVECPLAIAIEDERFIWRHMALLDAKAPRDTILLLSAGVIRAICEIDPRWLLERRVVLIDDVRKPYGRPRQSVADLRRIPGAVLNDKGDAGFSTDPDIGVFQGGSVAVSAVQFAAFCTPSTIGLIGIDIMNADQPRFYETSGDTAPSGIKRSQARILRHMVLAKDVCRDQGTHLRSHSPISLLNQIL